MILLDLPAGGKRLYVGHREARFVTGDDGHRKLLYTASATDPIRVFPVNGGSLGFPNAVSLLVYEESRDPYEYPSYSNRTLAVPDWLITAWHDPSTPLEPLLDWLVEHHGEAHPELADALAKVMDTRRGIKEEQGAP